MYSTRLHTRLRLDNNTPKPGSTHQANPTQDPTEDTTTPAAPTEVERHQVVTLDPKQSSNPPLTSRDKQGQPEHNPTPMDPPEHNPAEIEVNSIDITPKSYSWMRLTKFLSYSGQTINDPAPVSLP